MQTGRMGRILKGRQDVCKTNKTLLIITFNKEEWKKFALFRNDSILTTLVCLIIIL